jgi:uncharacterized LabA/DUF88 family protein
MVGHRVLVLVDIQNVFYGSKNYTKNSSQVDYAKLIHVIEQEVHDLIVARYPEAVKQFISPILTVYGYVVQSPKYNGIKLFALLRKLGYILRFKIFPDGLDPNAHWKGSVGALMQMDYIDWCANYDTVVVVSGSGVFEPVFKASAKNWPNVHRVICAFDNTLHKTYAERDDLADSIIYLDERVLR